MPVKFSGALLVTIVVAQAAFAQTALKAPTLSPGLHSSLTLRPPNSPAIHYALSIPPGYSPSAPVPLVLALHFGVGGGNATGAGRDVLQILWDRL